MNKEKLEVVVRDVVQELLARKVPVGISNRHIHLSQSDYNLLFPNQTIQKKKALLQTGEFAAEETVTLVGPKGKIEKVRLLGPLRKASQVEVALTDARQLGVKVPIAMSGDLSQAATVKLVSPFGEIEIKACIAAKRHIHMSPADALHFGVVDGQNVRVLLPSQGRTTILDDVIIRSKAGYVLEMHVDTDEANAANLSGEAFGIVLTEDAHD